MDARDTRVLLQPRSGCIRRDEFLRRFKNGWGEEPMHDILTGAKDESSRWARGYETHGAYRRSHAG